MRICKYVIIQFLHKKKKVIHKIFKYYENGEFYVLLLVLDQT